ncbi:hypothetical protein ACFE04_012090 [Oxalis oulophora]
MTNGWVKSLQCKSRAFEDVYDPNPKKQNLITSVSCRKTSQSIKDVVDTTKKRSSKPSPKHTKPDPVNIPRIRTRHSVSAPPDSFFPALTELPSGHPSRNVVEIIFQSSWVPKSFPGRVEMIFKVQNGSRIVARFEEFRDIVKSRARYCGGDTTEEENARCAADGNEMMQFHSLGRAAGYDGGGAWAFPGFGKGTVICTYAESREAHENAGGNGGRRAMLVCRVIAGRVKNRVGLNELMSDGRVGFDSVSGDNNNNGQLLVFDSRAVLPCFLIIYKL